MSIFDNRIVLDTNILFSLLLTQNKDWIDLLVKSPLEFYICEAILMELFQNKEKIIKYSRYSEIEVHKFYYLVLKRVNLFKEDLIDPHHWYQAQALCMDIDPADTPCVALTLELKGRLWTGDKKLKQALRGKGFYHFFEVPNG